MVLLHLNSPVLQNRTDEPEDLSHDKVGTAPSTGGENYQVLIKDPHTLATLSAENADTFQQSNVAIVKH